MMLLTEEQRRAKANEYLDSGGEVIAVVVAPGQIDQTSTDLPFPVQVAVENAPAVTAAVKTALGA